MAADPQYKSDRWATPGVLVAAILSAAVVLSIVAAGVTYLTARGISPDPMLDLVAKIGTLVTTTGTLALQLFGRTTATKTERNAGVLVSAVDELRDTVAAVAPAPAPRYAGAREPAYVVDLADEPAAGTSYAASVPPVPGLPRHLQRRRSDR